MRWSAIRWWATARSYPAQATSGWPAPAAQDRFGGEPAGEQRLPDALAGHHVGRRGGVADEQRAPAGERDVVDAGRDRPGGVAILEFDLVAERLAYVRPLEQVLPQALHRLDPAFTVAQHAEADVGPAVRERERPGVAGQ